MDTSPWRSTNLKQTFPLLTRRSPFLLRSQCWELGQLWLYNSDGRQLDGLQMQPPHLLCRADGG